jgi:hypothetical protein
MSPPFAPSAHSGVRTIDDVGTDPHPKGHQMVTQEQIQEIQATGKRSQGPLIDAAINSLVQNGRNLKEAFAELGEALGRSPGALSQGYFRRRKEKFGPARPPKPTADPVMEKLTVATSGPNGTSQHFKAILDIVEQMVEQRVQERLEQVRRALA